MEQTRSSQLFKAASGDSKRSAFAATEAEFLFTFVVVVAIAQATATVASSYYLAVKPCFASFMAVTQCWEASFNLPHFQSCLWAV